MKKYTQHEIVKFRRDLVDSLSPEQIVLYEVLADSIISNMKEMQNIANQAHNDSVALIESLNNQLEEAKRELEEMKKTLAKLGINL